MPNMTPAEALASPFLQGALSALPYEWTRFTALPYEFNVYESLVWAGVAERLIETPAEGTGSIYSFRRIDGPVGPAQEPAPGSPEAEPYDPGPAPWDDPDIDDGPDLSTIETDAGERYDPLPPKPRHRRPEPVEQARRQIAADFQARLREKYGNEYTDELLADAAERSRPEAVAQAAERTGSEPEILAQARSIRDQSDLESAARVLEWYLKNEQVEVSALRQQRDGLADALEACRKRLLDISAGQGQPPQFNAHEVRLATEALRKAGR